MTGQIQTHTSTQKRVSLSPPPPLALMAIDLFHFIIAQCFNWFITSWCVKRSVSAGGSHSIPSYLRTKTILQLKRLSNADKAKLNCAIKNQSIAIAHNVHQHQSTIMVLSGAHKTNFQFSLVSHRDDDDDDENSNH
jgi:hypothetical protein